MPSIDDLSEGRHFDLEIIFLCVRSLTEALAESAWITVMPMVLARRSTAP
jgi:hypothetical protein